MDSRANNQTGEKFAAASGPRRVFGGPQEAGYTNIDGSMPRTKSSSSRTDKQ